MPFVPGVVEDFIGRGIIFPLELSNGKAIVRTSFTLIQSSINIILGWPLGDRIFLAEFGSRLDELIEEPNDQVLWNLINTFVVDAINKWETRIDLIDVKIDRPDDRKINLSLSYKLVNTQQIETYIYPFYKSLNT